MPEVRKKAKGSTTSTHFRHEEVDRLEQGRNHRFGDRCRELLILAPDRLRPTQDGFVLGQEIAQHQEALDRGRLRGQVVRICVEPGSRDNRAGDVQSACVNSGQINRSASNNQPRAHIDIDRPTFTPELTSMSTDSSLSLVHSVPQVPQSTPWDRHTSGRMVAVLTWGQVPALPTR